MNQTIKLSTVIACLGRAMREADASHPEEEGAIWDAAYRVSLEAELEGGVTSKQVMTAVIHVANTGDVSDESIGQWF